MAEPSPFASGGGGCHDDQPAAAVQGGGGAGSRGAQDVVQLLDSPFASGMIGAPLLQQLSQSLADEQQAAHSGASTLRSISDMQHAAEAAAAQQQQAAGSVNGTNQGNSAASQVANILESPFSLSTALSVKLQDASVDAPLDAPLGKLPASADAAA